MTFYFRHESSGMRHGYIRHPDGSPPTPSGCRWCGMPERVHGRQYIPSKGWHVWQMPTNGQVKARMRARRKKQE